MSPCQAVEELGFSSFFSPHGFFVIFGIICVLGGPKFLAVKKKDSGLAGTHRTRVRTIRISKKKRRVHSMLTKFAATWLNQPGPGWQKLERIREAPFLQSWTNHGFIQHRKWVQATLAPFRTCTHLFVTNYFKLVCDNFSSASTVLGTNYMLPGNN